MIKRALVFALALSAASPAWAVDPPTIHTAGGYVQAAPVTMYDASGTIVSGGLTFGCTVVSADTAYTVGATLQPLTCTQGGRLRVGLSSAATIGTPASTIPDLAGAIDPSGNQQGLHVDASNRLITAPLAAGSNVIGGVTQADGANVTQGSLADAAATNSTSSWSVVALLKGIWAKLAGTLTVAGPETAGSAVTGGGLRMMGNNGGVARDVSVDGSGYVNVVIGGQATVQGTVASGSADSGNPVKVGGVAGIGTPVAAGQRTDWHGDLDGRQQNTRSQAFAEAPGLTASTTYNGSSRDAWGSTSGFSTFSYTNCYAYADQAYTVRAEASTDNSTWYRVTPDTTGAASSPTNLQVPITARYNRCVLGNGATTPTVTLLRLSFTAS